MVIKDVYLVDIESVNDDFKYCESFCKTIIEKNSNKTFGCLLYDSSDKVSIDNITHRINEIYIRGNKLYCNLFVIDSDNKKVVLSMLENMTGYLDINLDDDKNILSIDIKRTPF